MKRIILIILAFMFLFSCTTLDSTQPVVPVPEPYEDEDFSQWALDLRRGEIILIGSIPLVYMLTNLAYDNIMGAMEDSTGSNVSYSDNYHTQQKMMITLSLSGLITLSDYILGKIENNNEN
ncbi:MAG: hypothetical protein PF447_02305 [Spirochaetaceae bacterium]|jgi:uncharacterized membrane protein|nr:hypothetical protein [Spirochaetaceae bacterium]